MTTGYIGFANHFGPFRHCLPSRRGNAKSTPTAQHHDADDCNSHSDQHHRQRQSDSSNRVVALD
jgi:hypothetical protein